MSIKRPIPKPKIPKLKKPSISKRKRLTKSLSLSKKPTVQKNPSKPTARKKTSRKTVLGTCYLNKNCKGVLSRKVSKTQCSIQGGKSWKKTGGMCENI